MANTKLKLKKSSVSGRVPVAGDLEYGELAINYNDGKLYYRNSSNAIKAFNDTASTHTLITAFVDSDYVTARAGDAGIDSAAVTNLIDSDYVQARQSGGLIGDANTVVLNNFTGDSSTTAFTLTQAPTTEQHTLITINGVSQQTDAYTLSGTTLTLSEAPVNNDAIEVRTLRMQTGDVTVRDYANYVYQPTSATTAFTGADINSATLTYDVGKLEVFLNGSRLVNGLDFTATNGSSISLLGTSATSGDTVEISSFGAASITDETSNTVLSTTSSNQAVTSFNKTVYRTAKYIVQMTQNSRYHSQEVLLIHDGTTVSMVEYADIYTESDLGTVDADISGNAVRLLVTPNYTNTTVKTNRTEVAV
jgi:hypothetical protein